MKRRSHGEGTIYRRADGRWEARVTLGFDSRGRQVRRSVYGKTETQVLERRRELLSRLAGRLLDSEALELAGLAERWLENKAAPPRSLKPSTLASYRRILDSYILPELGSVRVQELTPLHVDRLLAELSRRGLSASTIGYVRRILSGIFRQARRWRLVGENPIEAVDPPRRARRSLETWSAAELEAFLEAAANHRLFALFYLAVTTGLREGELLALRRRDVDLAGGTLQVSRTVSYVSGEGLVVTTPKSERSRRTVRLTDEAVEVLRLHFERIREERRKAGELWRDGRLAFPSTVGTMISPRNLVRAFRALTRRAEVRPLRFHSLRHVYASLALRAGVPLLEVSERLGHYDPSFTLSVYGHVLEDLAGGALSLRELLGSQDETEEPAPPATRASPRELEAEGEETIN